MQELLSYVFSPLREGDIALFRGSGDGLAPILLVAAEGMSLGSVERLEHEYALKAELDAEWAARPVVLTHYNDRLTLVLEDPGGAPVDRLLGRPQASPSTRCLRGHCPSRLPIRWSGCTAISRGNRCRPTSGSRASRARSRLL